MTERRGRFAPVFAAFLIILIDLSSSEVCVTPVCKYDFVVRGASTMVYKTPKNVGYSVGLNGRRLQVIANTKRRPPDPIIGTYVNASEVITADGYRRNIITINDQFPGPAIEVMEGAEVIVKVTNKMSRQGMTVHWHGITQKGSPWMDGVPRVTQCPIDPQQSLTYRFTAEPAGTHWYHSHVTGQLTDGLYGIFVVHRKPPKLTEFPMLASDWYHDDGGIIEIVSTSSIDKEDVGDGDNIFSARILRDYAVDNTPVAGTMWIAGLINGRGRFKGQPFPLTTYNVKSGETYRFRMINVGAEYSLRVSIDWHRLRVVATDGYDIIPVEADFILVSPGERFDFEIIANQPVDRYWVRARSPYDVRRGTPDHEVNAVLAYEPLSGDVDPTTTPKPCTASKRCRAINCPFIAYPDSFYTDCIPITELESAQDPQLTDSTYGIEDKDVQEIFINIGYHGVGTSINARKFVPPTAPLFQRDAVQISCNKACRDNTKGCRCTNTVKLVFNKTIQVVMSNLQPIWKAGPHPMHIHGHSFAVTKMGFALQNTTTGHYTGFNKDVVCDDDGSLCLTTRWRDDLAPHMEDHRPVIKDTVWLPARAYVVVRFKATNPGYWLVHCHMNHHLEGGMTMLFNEAPGYYPPPPADFPTCYSFDMSQKQFNDYNELFRRYYFGPGNLGHKIGDAAALNALIDKSPAEKTGSKVTNMQCLPSEDHITLRTIDLIGGAVGLVLAGMVAAIIPIFCYVCCRRTTKRSKIHS